MLVSPNKPRSSIAPHFYERRTDLSLKASALSQEDAKDDNIISASMAVGAITAALGFLYGKVLGVAVKTIWSTIPNRLGDSLNPAYFITGTFTIGGLLMGILSSKLHSTFAVSDFVSALSSAPAETLPSSSIHLFPLLLLSLVTSAFGFSVGPEAPMVCAGGLVGASLARYWYGRDEAERDPVMSKKHQETLAYAGAAGSLTAFMGIPIAGSIFALELTRSNAGLSKAGDALSPAVIASVAAIALIRAFLVPYKAVGGHFNYGMVGALSGRTMIATALACGTGGALIGTVFHKLVHALKHIAWPSTNNDSKSPWKRQILVKTAIGLMVGILSTNYPQTMFWGEGSRKFVA